MLFFNSTWLYIRAGAGPLVWDERNVTMRYWSDGEGWSGVKLYFRSCWQTCLSLYTSPPNYHFDWSLNESVQSKSILTTKNIQINLVTFANSHLTLRCSLHYAQVFEIGDSPDTILTYNIFWHVLALNSSKSINYTY